MTLKNLLKNLKLNYANSDITEVNFPNTKRLLTDAKIFQFNRTISSEDAIKEMEKEGYKPANLRELLSWGAKNWNGQDFVVALGQAWRGPLGGRYVPCLGAWYGERGLGLGYLGLDWDGCCRFLAFKVDSSVEKVDNEKNDKQNFNCPHCGKEIQTSKG